MHLLPILFLSFVFSGEVTGAPVTEEKITPVDLAYSCLAESTGKSPVLLIHGLGSSRTDWDGVFTALLHQTGREICAVDLRNHGGSKWNNRSDVAAMAADIEHFMDQRKFKKLNLVGHSLGGKIAIHFTLNNPGRVDSIVVEDMRPNGITEMALTLIQGMTTYLSEAMKTVPEGSTVEEARKKILEFITEKLEEIGMESLLEEHIIRTLPIICENNKCRWTMNMDLLVEAMKDPLSMLTESKGVYEGPALFIYGTESIFDVGDDKPNIRKLFPKVKFVAVEGAGHSIHGKYQEFEDEVIKFLNNLM